MISNSDCVTRTTAGFPKVDTLWRGVILRCIVNGIMIAESPDLARFLSWDSENYVLNNADGTYAAITFNGAHVVGVFFDSQSSLNPYISPANYDINVFFQNMPRHLRALAENQTLKYNCQNVHGKRVSIITAAFWNDGDYLTAAFPWEDVFRNGAHIVDKELMEDTEAALKEWQDSYQCSAEATNLARSLFSRKISAPSNIIVLSKLEVAWLQSRSNSPEAFDDCVKALKPLRIVPPP